MTWEHFPEPRYAPARDTTWKTEGGEIARVARLLGKELMPWQRFVVDRATEYRDGPNGRRVYRYSTVLVTVPRQSGKTTLVGPVQVHRIITRPGANAFFTAQTGHAAGRRMQDLLKLAMESPLKSVLTPRYQNGSEGLSTPHGSVLRRFAPTEDAIHGETPHLVTIDEIWKFTAAKGEALRGGFSPAQITLHGQAQTWLISTRGTAASGFMNALVDTGRAGGDPDMAYFEWSLPEGADPYAPESWWQYHPALGNTITEEALRAEREKLRGSPGEWLRAYANVLTAAEDPIIDPEVWKEHADPAMTPPEDLSSVGLAYEVAPENAVSSVVASWRTPEGHPRTRVVYQAPGSGWLADFVDYIATEWGARPAADDGGPARRITEQLVSRGHDVLTTNMGQRGSADGEWLASVLEHGTLRHDGSAAFSSAVANATPRTTNGVTRIDRDRSLGPVTSVIASSVALWAFDYAEQPLEPQIW